MSKPVKYAQVKVKLTGTDGNVFAVIGSVTRAMRRADIPKEEVDKFRDSCFACKSYDAVLLLCMRTVDVS